MSLRFPRRSADGHSATPAPAQGQPRQPSGAPEQADSPASYPDRACCCPARPLVKVVIPGSAARPAADLWLCGHHWRASRQALSGTGAVVYDVSVAETEPATAPQGVVV
jgi:hypothetical protein